MKRLIIGSLVSLFLAACGGNTAVPTPMPTAESVDVQATVDAAVSATATGEAAMQAQIDEAVNEAITATAAAATPETAAPEDVIVMTEDELAALIEETVNEANAASEAYADATTQATTDDTLTSEEVDEIYLYVEGTEELIAYAEELITLYDDLYGELTTATMDDLAAIEQELETLNQNLETMNQVLADVDSSLEAGLALADETITQLETAAADAAATAQTLQTQAQAWQEQVQAEIAARTAMIQDLPPMTIPGSQPEALAQAGDYANLVRAALEDNSLSQAELNNIAQAGADAIAGLQAHGGPQLQGLADAINTLTMQLAGGGIQPAINSLNDLSGMIPNFTLPSLPSVPDISAPSLPSVPRPSRP